MNLVISCQTGHMALIVMLMIRTTSNTNRAKKAIPHIEAFCSSWLNQEIYQVESIIQFG